MKVEEHFSQMLRRAVATRPKVEDPWGQFERRVRRRRRTRLLGGVASTVLVVAASVVVVPRLIQSGETTTPITSSSADPYEGWAEYGEELRFRYPDGWIVEQLTDDGGVGHRLYEIRPKDLPATATGQPTFGLTLETFTEWFNPSGSQTGIGMRADRRAYLRSEAQGAGGSREVVYRIDWSPTCALENPGCTIGPTTLVVRVFASEESLWERYGESGEQVAMSIRWVDWPDWPTFASEPADHFAVTYPVGWTVEGLDGPRRYEIRPPGQTATSGKPTFAVTITHVSEWFDPANPKALPPGATTRADGRPYKGEWSFPAEGPQEATLRISWMPPCAYKSSPCAAEPATLVVRIFASNRSLWLRYSELIDNTWQLESYTYV